MAPVKFSVHVQPGARAEGVVRWQGGVLYLRVKAPPVDGRANEAVERLLAKLLGVPPSAVTVERGAGGRSKLVAVEGVDAATLRARLGAPDAG